MGKRAPVGVVLALALILASLGLPAGPAAQAPEPPESATEALQRMDDRIQDARAKHKDGSPGEVKDLANEAGRLKLQAIRDGFRGQIIHGCQAGALIANLELIDKYMAHAVAGKPSAEASGLSGAKLFAKTATEFVDGCGDQRERVLAGQIRDIVTKLHERAKQGDVSKAKLRKSAERVELLKREMVAGERVYGCDVMRFFSVIQSLDRALASAAVTDDRKLRGSLLRKAESEADTLIVRWRELPCGEQPPPPPPNEFTVTSRLSWFHVNGFGNPPSRECNKVTTSPGQGGATITDVVTLPDGEKVTKTAEADQGGGTTISMNIDQTGTYTHVTTVVGHDGVTETVTESQTVTAETTGEHGECPPP